MRTILAIALIFIASAVLAAPFLVCDPNAGVTYYKITGDAYWTANIPAQADGSIKTDLSGIASGTHSINVAACVTDSVWGEQCSATSPFEFTRPGVPGVPTNTKLAP